MQAYISPTHHQDCADASFRWWSPLLAKRTRTSWSSANTVYSTCHKVESSSFSMKARRVVGGAFVGLVTAWNSLGGPARMLCFPQLRLPIKDAKTWHAEFFTSAMRMFQRIEFPHRRRVRFNEMREGVTWNWLTGSFSPPFFHRETTNLVGPMHLLRVPSGKLTNRESLDIPRANYISLPKCIPVLVASGIQPTYKVGSYQL